MNIKTTLLLFVVVICLPILSCKNSENKKESLDSLSHELEIKRVLLPNGWSLSPIGKSLPLGDLPLNVALAPTARLIAVTNNGQGRQSIMLIDPISEKILDDVEIKKSWYGLTFNNDGTLLYASGGNDNIIVIYSTENAHLKKIDSITLGKPWPVKISPTGLAIDDKAHKLYVGTKEDSALYVCDLNTKQSKRIGLMHEAYTCLLSPDKKKLYVSMWGGNQVAVVDTDKEIIVKTIAVGSNPNDMVLTRDGKFLFVAQGNDNAVSVIETKTGKVVEVFTSAMYPDSPAGSTANALALSEDEKRLYIANADNNCVAVFDIETPGQSKSIGFIPTDWYPTALKVLNKKLWVANGKGGTSLPNPKGPNPYKRRDDSTQYIASLFKGTMRIIPEPSESELSVYSTAVYKNSPYNSEIKKLADGENGNPIPRRAGQKSPIKYVFYVIKENRTYDQVLGDMKEGNGDSSLCLFPKQVSPNHHALASEYVLLDNFYVNAEVSADGHNWSTAAYANDYVEKTWPTKYSQGRGGSYDYEGTRHIAYPKDGFIWDYCKRAGISYRSYGEFVDEGKANLSSLEGHFDPYYPGFDMNISDLTRAARWQRDFDSLLLKDAVPRFSTIRLSNDHTSGAKVGMLTPRAFVAENDLALGRIIEHISKSEIWKESAIFVVEDDAQNGPDHVDAHRSIALIASPYVKKNARVSTMYSTASMLRTIELILGLPPMSQYDAGAKPMWECFTLQQNTVGYECKPASYNLKEMNNKLTSIAIRSAAFNLAVMDSAPDLEFNQIIWKSIKGLGSEMPSPKRSAFIRQLKEVDDDE